MEPTSKWDKPQKIIISQIEIKEVSIVRLEEEDSKGTKSGNIKRIKEKEYIKKFERNRIEKVE